MGSEHNSESSRPCSYQDYLQSLPVIEKSWVKDYRKQLDILYRELVALNSYIYIMEKIAEFRFDLFIMPKNYYWNLIFASMSETCLSIVWRTVCDRNAKTLTLLNLKTAIISHLVDDENGARFKATLEESGFEKTAAEVREKIEKIRHGEIAHLGRKWFTNTTAQKLAEARVHLPNIKVFAKSVSTLFQLLCIGHSRRMTLGDYGDDIVYPADMDGRSDIEELLDLVARENGVLNMPEEQANFWPTWRDEHLSSEDVDVIDEYRKKFDLPPVPR